MRTRNVFAVLGVLALAMGTLTTPALADPHGDHGGGRGGFRGGEHGGRGGWGHGGDRGGWGDNRWSHDDWHGHPGFQPGYYAPPSVYYPPPPQPYYAPPGINMFLPLP